MRRVVTALALVMATVALAACSGSPTAGTTSGTTAGTPVPASTAPAAGTAVAANTDILSPTQPVTPGEMFPTDPASVPQAILDNLAAKKPMLVYFYDPTTQVATDQRRSINSAISKYRGEIELMTFNYTAGLGSTATTLPAELAKAELMTGLLKVNTTPYMVFVDRYGRITYRFAGFIDSGLLEREVLRATE